MENINTNIPNCNDYFTPVQLSLSMDVGVVIPENDPVYSFLKALEGVNLNVYLKRSERRGRKGYDNLKLLKILLFARMVNITSLRQIASSCTTDIRFMYLADYDTPSHMAFERLIKEYLIKDIDAIFFDISRHIGELMDVDFSCQYIDGTKIEANANRYKFVYKKRIITARKKLYTKITEEIIKLNQSRGFCYLYGQQYCSYELLYLMQYLLEIMRANHISYVYGTGKRKHELQRYYDHFMTYYQKLNEYEYWLEVIGEGRNSCTKTDPGATMGSLKMDYYNQSGITTPCYNAQIAVSDGIIVNADLFQKPADAKTFIPFMERYHENTGEYPEYPMADAGYGTYDNYMFCLKHHMNLVMKYPMYARKHTAEFKKRKFDSRNWETNESGYKVCPNGLVFDQYQGEKYDENGEYLRIIQHYTSKESCKGCPFHDQCCKRAEQERRILSRDVVLNTFYGEVDEELSTEYGKNLKKQRTIQVEGAFGVIKQNMRFTRFTRRGLNNTKMEFLIVCLGYNLRKYHHYRLRKQKAEKVN